MFSKILLSLSLVSTALIPLVVAAEGDEDLWIRVDAEGRLVYRADEKGNTIPDFSRAGYRGGGVELPYVPVVKTLNPTAEGDDMERIQAALDEVGSLPEDEEGRRGALLLTRGVYRISETIHVPGGVVLRGEGQDEDGTVLIATERNRQTLMTVGSRWPRPPSVFGNTLHHLGTEEIPDTRREITDSYVPWSAKRLTLEHLDGLSVGDRVIAFRRGSDEWIAEIGMDRIERLQDPYKTIHQWRGEQYSYPLERFIVALHPETNEVTLDSPLNIAFEERFGGGFLYRADSPRARECGVENLRIEATFLPGREQRDTERAARGIVVIGAENAWIRDVTGLYFNGGFSVDRTSIFTTVQDSRFLDPVGPIRGGFRYGFSQHGQYGLMKNLYTRNSRHAFSTSFRVRGPNVFLDCVAEISHSDSGPHERFALGTLYDNVSDDDSLKVQDRGDFGTGQGWAGAQQVFWNCTVGRLVVQSPPTAENWAIGCIAQELHPGRFPDRAQGVIQSLNRPVEPRSLYLAQLAERLGREADK